MSVIRVEAKKMVNGRGQFVHVIMRKREIMIGKIMIMRTSVNLLPPNDPRKKNILFDKINAIVFFQFLNAHVLS